MMRSTFAILILVILSVSWPALSAPPCYHFEPAASTISGTLVRKTFPGPPNYEDIKAGDEPEIHWYIKLARPICVEGTPGDQIDGHDVGGVNLVQLVLMHDEYKTHRRLLGKKVRATGTLFSRHTGHHHTPVLLIVSSLEGSKK